MSTVTPLGSRLLVVPLPPETKTSGGILLAARYAPEQQIYLVLSVGPGRKLSNGTRVSIPIDPGQRVLIDQYSIQSRIEAGTTPDGSTKFLIESDAVSLIIP